MIDFKRADHVHICVPPDRLEEAKDFYTGIIGLKLIERPDHLFSSAGYWLAIGDIQLHIGVEPATGRTIRHTAFEISNLAEVAKHFKQHNVQMLEEPFIPGRQRFAFLDPFGNRMELLQYID